MTKFVGVNLFFWHPAKKFFGFYFFINGKKGSSNMVFPTIYLVDTQANQTAVHSYRQEHRSCDRTNRFRERRKYFHIFSSASSSFVHNPMLTCIVFPFKTASSFSLVALRRMVNECWYESYVSYEWRFLLLVFRGVLLLVVLYDGRFIFIEFSPHRLLYNY